MERDYEFDIVVWGATGSTGRRVSHHLAARTQDDGDLRWALAGRNRAKLESVRSGLGPGAAEVGDARPRDPQTQTRRVRRRALPHRSQEHQKIEGQSDSPDCVSCSATLPAECTGKRIGDQSAADPRRLADGPV